MALKLTREFYIPKGSVKVTQKPELGDGVVYLYQNQYRDKTVFGLVAFCGRRTARLTNQTST